MRCECFRPGRLRREQRWADEITPTILVGDPVYLTLASGHRFLAIHAPSANARAGVVVVHGIGIHPDWGLINTLRSALSEQGYATLSIQMPVLDLYGEKDLPSVLQAAHARKSALASVNGAKQAQVPGADHFFNGRSAELVRAVREFLDAQFPR